MKNNLQNHQNVMVLASLENMQDSRRKIVDEKQCVGANVRIF